MEALWTVFPAREERSNHIAPTLLLLALPSRPDCMVGVFVSQPLAPLRVLLTEALNVAVVVVVGVTGVVPPCDEPAPMIWPPSCV